MSEVDRLSTSGTYPALPMAAKRRAKEDSGHADAHEKREETDGRPEDRNARKETHSAPRPPTSLIDEYA